MLDVSVGVPVGVLVCVSVDVDDVAQYFAHDVARDVLLRVGVPAGIADHAVLYVACDVLGDEPDDVAVHVDVAGDKFLSTCSASFVYNILCRDICTMSIYTCRIRRGLRGSIKHIDHRTQTHNLKRTNTTCNNGGHVIFRTPPSIITPRKCTALSVMLSKLPFCGKECFPGFC